MIVDLRQLQTEDLDVLLSEEIEFWQRHLDWDYTPSADLVRRFVRAHSLGGAALLDSRQVAGYVYWITEDQKGLIGDLFVSRSASQVADFEMHLLHRALDVLSNTAFLHRIESQLMVLSDQARCRVANLRGVKTLRRDLLVLDLPHHFPLPSPPAGAHCHIAPWHEREQEQAARLIARSYQGHPDAQINDQYRSLAGARRFLANIVQYPGCGSFFGPGSLVALDPIGGSLVGLCLSSLVAFDVGHITQICVDPEWQHRGVGYELLRRSLLALSGAGARRVSLTVTSSNASALNLYARVGFRHHTSFDAFVWEQAWPVL